MNENEDIEQFDLSFRKKKKKKEKKEEDEKKDEDEKDNNDEKDEKDEYDYMYLLDRFYSKLREDRPSLFTPQKQVIPLPNIARAGSKKVMWSNYGQTVDVLRRPIDHVQAYFSYELNCECSIDANMHLIMKGKFSGKQIESILRKYILMYVACNMCKSHDTSLTRDPVTRLCFINCEKCKSSRSVSQIRKEIKK